MGILNQLEEQADQTVTQEMRQMLQDALDHYTGMCKDCGLAMHRHHSYPRTIVTKYGELDLSIPVFRCGECGGMVSGMGLIGEDESRKRYSKKRATRL